MIQVFTPAQTKILEALAKYKFLTSSQMIRLGISNRRSNLSVMLKPLKESRRAFVGEMEFAFIPSKGRLENFYYLKPKGKKALEESGILEDKEIKFPKGRTVLFTQDYFHRKYTLDCHIACQLACIENGLELVFFDRYFDKVGSNRNGANLHAKTKIALFDQYLIADGALMIRNGESSKLYAVELYNDTNSKRIVDQLNKHVEGVKHSSLCRIYGMEKGHRVLSVFTHPETKIAVMKRMEDSSFGKYFLFNDYETMMVDFFKGWKDFNNSTHNINR